MARGTWITLGFWVALVVGAGTAEGKQPPDLAQTIPFASEEGMKRLSQSKHRVDFARLAQQFEPQISAGHCGPASAVVVLNALRLYDASFDKPTDTSVLPKALADRIPKRFNPFLRRYSQRVFFDDKTESIKTMAQFTGQPAGPNQKPDPGFQLRQLHRVLEKHGLSSTLKVVAKTTRVDDVRRDLLDNLARADDYVIVNFFRPSLGQKGGGHLSPVGAYDKASDSFLVLDVNPTRQPWFWVRTDNLVKAMRTKDAAENRGYLLLKE
jgi:hypothetical protein